MISTKYRRKVLKAGFGEYLKRRIFGIGETNPEIEIIEINPDQDHVHMLLSIPPKYSVAHTIGLLKGKSASEVMSFGTRNSRMVRGRTFWARGYCVSTVGLDEAVIRAYIKNQEQRDKSQMDLPF